MRVLLAIDDTESCMSAVTLVARWAARLEVPYIRLLQTLPPCRFPTETRNSQISTWEQLISRTSQAFDRAKTIFAQQKIVPPSINSVLWLDIKDGQLSSVLMKEARMGRFNRIILGSKRFSSVGSKTNWTTTVNSLFLLS